MTCDVLLNAALYMACLRILAMCVRPATCHGAIVVRYLLVKFGVGALLWHNFVAESSLYVPSKFVCMH